MRQIRQGSLGSADETFEALHEEISTLRSRCAFLQKAVDGKAKEHFAALQAQNASLKKVNAKLRLSYSELKLKHEPLDQGAARRRSERKTPDLLTLSAGGGI